MAKKFEYATWRTDGPKEEGFSHELIANETEKFCKETGATLDNMNGL